MVGRFLIHRCTPFSYSSQGSLEFFSCIITTTLLINSCTQLPPLLGILLRLRCFFRLLRRHPLHDK